MMLYMLVERKQLGVGRRVVGLEEGEIEVVLVDGYVENKTDSAHSN